MSIIDQKIAQIEFEITEAQLKIKKLKKLKEREKEESVIRLLDEVTDEEKIAAFDTAYRLAYNTLQECKESSWDEEVEYFFEHVMEFLARPGRSADFWKYFNKIRE